MTNVYISRHIIWHLRFPFVPPWTVRPYDEISAEISYVHNSAGLWHFYWNGAQHTAAVRNITTTVRPYPYRTDGGSCSLTTSYQEWGEMVCHQCVAGSSPSPYYVAHDIRCSQAFVANRPTWNLTTSCRRPIDLVLSTTKRADILTSFERSLPSENGVEMFNWQWQTLVSQSFHQKLWLQIDKI